MKKCVLFFIFLGLFVLGWGQKPNIHKRSEYYTHSKQLKVRFEYYYDYWAEKEVKQGRYSEWSKKGRLQRDCVYENNLLMGEEKCFDTKERLQKCTIWQAGKQQKTTVFYPNSLVKKEIFYSNIGKIQNTISYYPNNTCKSKVAYSENAKAVIVKYKRNGEERQAKTMKDFFSTLYFKLKKKKE